ncbi:MAG: glycosyltransferase family 4 protein [Chloroflexi bacterium]|nr:MAG: glycosyltransferase family 4 protein [Chloroflexota bacterium]
MKIAVVASPVTPLRPAQQGGAQAFLCDLATGLAERGHDVRLHCAEGSDVAGVRLVMVPAPRDARAALVIPGGAPPPPAPGVAAALEAMFDAIAADRVDAVSQHAFDALAFTLARGLPVLHTLHLPPIVESVVRAAVQVEGARLATVSASCQATWRSAGVEVGELLPNGVGDEPVPAKPDHTALIAGRISPEKGIEHALAAARNAGLAVRIAGAPYDPAYEVDLSATEQLGSLTRRDLRLVMARSAVTICAIRWEEPFGMVAAEAQMAGCPVAAYRRGALPEVVEEGVSGYLAAPDDIGDLSHAIRRCLALDRAAVRASARRRLGLGVAVDRYEKALERAAQ